MKLPGVDPERLYSIAEAARLLPSNHNNKRISVHCFYRWHARGHLPLVRRKTSRNAIWFVLGKHLEALFEELPSPPQEEYAPASLPRTREENDTQQRAVAAALLRDHGLVTGPNPDGSIPPPPVRKKVMRRKRT